MRSLFTFHLYYIHGDIEVTCLYAICLQYAHYIQSQRSGSTLIGSVFIFCQQISLKETSCRHRGERSLYPHKCGVRRQLQQANTLSYQYADAQADLAIHWTPIHRGMYHSCYGIWGIYDEYNKFGYGICPCGATQPFLSRCVTTLGRMRRFFILLAILGGGTICELSS